MAWNPDALPEFGADKDFGGETETWVRNYQTAADLSPTGTVDGLTGGFLLEYVADHADGGDDAGHIDAYTKNESDVRFAGAGHPHAAITTIK